jgi:GMP synthase-like glutamine amidotransferase
MSSKRRILILQHIAIEHPGIFRTFLAEDGIAWDAIELNEGGHIPDLNGYDALWVMGGPMDVWEKDEYPWLEVEISVIREAVSFQKLPYLGLCLGHQLLAEALGGKVGPAAQPEIGILDVHLTEAGMINPIFEGISNDSKCLQWHSAEVLDAPAGAEILASSDACKVQAMLINGNALGLQYHVEISGETVADWARVPEYEAALARNLGSGAVDRMAADAAGHMNEFNQSARLIYDNWKMMAFG